MPFGSEGLEDLTGLALSGGGFRATLFHLGSFWRLVADGQHNKEGRSDAGLATSFTGYRINCRDDWNGILGRHSKSIPL